MNTVEKCPCCGFAFGSHRSNGAPISWIKRGMLGLAGVMFFTSLFVGFTAELKKKSYHMDVIVAERELNECLTERKNQ